MTAVLRSRGHNVHFLDARKVVTVRITDVGDGREIQWCVSQQKLADELASAPSNCHLVITGFIASTTDGVMTTLRRDGRCCRWEWQVLRVWMGGSAWGVPMTNL